MNTTWEYKTVTVTNGRGMLRLTEKPNDDESTTALNREGTLGWDLVSVVCLAGVSGGVTFYFKRPR